MLFSADDHRCIGHASPIRRVDCGILLQSKAHGSRGPGDDHTVGVSQFHAQPRRAGGLQDRNDSPETAFECERAPAEFAGIRLPDGLKESAQLPEPIFTPATKAQSGHDENISFDVAAGIVGADIAAKLRDLTLTIYKRASEYARPPSNPCASSTSRSYRSATR